MTHADAGTNTTQLNGATENVRNRKEQQGRGIWREEDISQTLHDIVHLEHKVLVGEHAALGSARGA